MNVCPFNLQDVEAISKGEPVVIYDAMVVHGESDEDTSFAEHVVQRMEAKGVDLKVFFPLRDLKAGTIQHAAQADIISARCRKVVAIFSQSFADSPDNMFLTQFAQHISIMTGRSKILPIIYGQCEIPELYKMYHSVRYNPNSNLVNFWDKLIKQPFALKHLPEEVRKMDFYYKYPQKNEQYTYVDTQPCNARGFQFLH